MRILVTNDDGWDAPGIRALGGALAGDGHDVVVVAPESDRSGASAAIGPLHQTDAIPVTERRWQELPDVPVSSIDAPPATAVYAACLGAFGDAPDLVASGVNPGANTGHLVLHSGTVGAALTAAGLGVPGLAVSLKWAEDDLWHFETAAQLAVAALEWVIQHEGAPRVLNLNAPNLVFDEVRGVREARLAPYGEVWVASADASSGDLRLEFKGREGEPDPTTDIALVQAGFASVTPLLGIVEGGLAGAAEVVAAALGAPSPT